MDEQAWLVSADPTKMLIFIKGRRQMRTPYKQRKQRLFAVASCWRVASLIQDDRSTRCLEVAEGVADDVVTIDQVRAAEYDTRSIWLRNAGNDAALALNQLFSEKLDGLHVSTSAMSAVFEQQGREAKERVEPLAGRREGACPSEALAQSELIRCIFGNPFRPVVFDPSWRTEAVVALAAGVYADRAFGRLPVLADALEDAGCANPDVLGHCRSPGPHARGCWVVDLVLGKA